MRVDVHQHVWTEPLVEALAARRALPRVLRGGGGWMLHVAGERPSALEVDAADRRREQLRADGLDAAIVAISSPIGIEALPADEAEPLIAAHLAGVASLGAGFGRWGPVTLASEDAADVDRRLEEGCAGVSLPAGALAGRGTLERAGPWLERLAARGAPLFVHPGPGLVGGAGDAGPGAARREADPDEPPWWSALTGYVAGMQAAWLAFAAHGRRAHPRLTVIFSMLAGGAPLLSERLATRRGPDIELHDPLTFYDTSSYGPVAVAAMADRVGAAQLVYGSDRPVIEPLATDRDAALQGAGARFVPSSKRTPPAS